MRKLIRKVFKAHPSVKLAYLFGSTAKGDRGPMSDYDFAIFLDERDKQEITRVRFKLIDELSRTLKTDKIDVVMLNDTESPELKYNILQEGELIFERDPFRVIVEPQILNEYFDFYLSLKKHGLTKA
jgi:hypothetical protein